MHSGWKWYAFRNRANDAASPAAASSLSQNAEQVNTDSRPNSSRTLVAMFLTSFAFVTTITSEGLIARKDQVVGNDL
jgi:hypothetical protein